MSVACELVLQTPIQLSHKYLQLMSPAMSSICQTAISTKPPSNVPWFFSTAHHYICR